MTAIAISRTHFPVTSLGPGRRLGIWFQGCSIRCPGCISADTWKAGLGRTVVADLLGAVESWLSQADGVTISGGEPFDQPDALKALLHGVRRRSDGDILVFTGYPIEALDHHVRDLNGLLDALVSDPYLQEATQSLALRGSDNQRLHLLTSLGHARFASFERRKTPDDRRLDVMFDETGAVWFAGIPAHGDFERLSEALTASGHQISHTQDKSSVR